MKVIATPTSIISLENVRRVAMHVDETHHTSYGKPYTLTHYHIGITYCDKGYERIECGDNDSGRDLCEATFKLIFDKLSED